MVRNKYVKIQHGKEIVRKNNILDAYPEHIAKRQMGTLDTTSTGINETDNQFELSTLLLKLDTPLEGLKEMGVNKLNITGEDLEGDLSVVNNGDNSLTINGSLPVDEGTTVEGTSFTLTDAQPDKKASITKLEGNTTQNGTPTPSNPVEIKTVSGDNEVVVTGSNFLDIEKIKTQTWTNNVYRGTRLNDINSRGTWCFKAQLKEGKTAISGLYVAIAQTINPNASTNAMAIKNGVTQASTKTFTSTDLYISFYPTSRTIQEITEVYDLWISKTNTDYEPYVGNSYRVDFGGKNLIDIKDNLIGTHGGITTTYNEDNSITITGTPTNTWAWLTNEVTQTLPIGQYTLSITNVLTFRIYVQLTFADNTTQNYIVNNGVKALTFTTSKVATKYRVILSNLSTGTTYNETTKVMLASGTDTNFSPYVSNPLYFPEINGYKNKLKRAEGKNKFNDTLRNGVTNYQTGAYSSSTSRLTSTEWTVLPAGTYTFNAVSTTGKTLYVSNITFDTSDNFLNIPNFSGQWLELPCTFTLTQDIKWKINIRDSNYGNISSTEVIKVMLNEGSTALPYEPYGNNWYIEKNIGKVAINGSESGWSKSGTNTSGYNRFANSFLASVIKRPSGNNDTVIGLSDKFVMETANNTYRKTNGISFNSSGTMYIYFDTYATETLDNFKTWLSTNNIIFYYALATPSYEIITNENLLEQLNNIQDIELIENLCYVDWVGEEKPDMTLKYNYETEYEYDLGVQDFTLSANTNYNVNANGLSLKLANNSTIYEGAGTYTPTQDTEVTSAKLLIPLGVNFSSTVYPTVEKQSGLRNTEFDVHYVDSLDISVTNYKCFTTLTKNGCIARYQYTYDRHSRFRSYRDGQVYDMADLNGRRITAIGFACNWIGGGSYQSTREVLAVLDTSNYALYINQEIPMNITRVDEITSDAEFYTNNTEITGPLHLDPLRTNCDKERRGI